MSESILAGREQTRDLQLDCDVVVVGSGASGAVVATELAEAGQDVVVLEEGPHVPPEVYGRMRPSETLRHMWRDGGTSFALGLGGSPVINVMMGRCVGGSSVLTGGVCFRIPDGVLEEWVRDHGLDGMTPQGMEACFQAVERAMHVEEVPVAMRSRSTTLFVDGARKLGVAMAPMRRNTSGCNGCGRCNFGCPHGAKQSVDVSYLPRARARGARIVSDALVEDLLLDGDRARGVLGYFLDGPRARKTYRFTVRAKRVVVACGAYHSPLLLRRAGVGRRSGQVGRNLTLHPSFRIMARFDDPVHGWRGALQSAWTDHFHDDQITLTGMFVPPGVLAGTLPGIGPSHTEKARLVPNLAVFGGLIHDRGSGTIRRGFGREPIVTYRMAKEDRAAMPVLMRRMAEIFFAGGAREVFLPILGSPPVKPDGLATLDLTNLNPSRLECSSQHPLGTCRMGVSKERSVVKPTGETWDVRELYVADGSVLPTSLGVNPQVSVMAVATKIAWGMRETRFA
ncbi:MAG TPA: GMC family oxidoreductase [Polyangiaceae bacterium]|jgi:choline dehydrogenase-like flavoprotein